MRPLVIGIAGGTGSGKTTLTKEISQHFGTEVTVLYHDNYYKRNDHLTFEERTQLNYDAPEAFDTDLMIADLQRLIRGETVQCPQYDFSIHNRLAETITVSPRPVIIIEGILIFCFPELCDLFDIKLFVDTDADVRILRRVKRDVIERGRSIESVEEQYLTTVKPMHELYVEPSKRNADLIVPEGGHNNVALEMIINRLERHFHL
ncbi:uridine kinase [Gleimia sp. 6138-11-ORH1]|uniref:uridine kinase n=1 Tax=Gleimia sp. 6138-11-ORH1 TaxID=2973937 RepID=UPI00216764DB|nr:uridine kinase [Gleimia sp. 6138-11-ORH1]MCS4484463.1 uridine kinase [Gleimia sp. 6138-11-ORH1]